MADDTYMDMWKKKLGKNKNFRFFFSEFIGTTIFVFFAECIMGSVLMGDMLPSDSVNLLKSKKILVYAVGSGAAYAIAMAIGANQMTRHVIPHTHINPAVTLAAALTDIFPWNLVPAYLLAQCLGGILGALLVFSVQRPNLLAAEPDGLNLTRRVFAAYPTAINNDHRTIILMWDQAWTSALMVLLYLSVYDTRGIVSGRSFTLAPFFSGAALTAIILANGIVATAAINPARDFTGRAISFFWYGVSVWKEPIRSTTQEPKHYFWVPLLVPYFGALVGSFLYAVAISLHKSHFAEDHGGRLDGRRIQKLRDRLKEVEATLGAKEFLKGGSISPTFSSRTDSFLEEKPRRFTRFKLPSQLPYPRK